MFNTGCNIYSIAKNTFLFEDHITNVDPNPDRNPWFFSQGLLDFHCTTCGFESALEATECSVTVKLKNCSAMSINVTRVSAR